MLWWLTAIWFIIWVLNRDIVHNWFRIPCDLSQAHVVYVWARDQREVLSVNVSFFITMARSIKVRYCIPLT